jgi:hypothetical protein
MSNYFDRKTDFERKNRRLAETRSDTSECAGF